MEIKNWYGVPSPILEMNPRAKEEEQKERQKILEKFTIGPFEDIVARSEAKVCTDAIRIFRLIYIYIYIYIYTYIYIHIYVCVCVFPLVVLV